METVIKVENLARSFRTKGQVKRAVDGISFEVKKGEVFGLLGPNGAGKTTTIKMLTTLLLPTEGRAEIFGYDVHHESHEIRKLINFVYGGERGVYGRLTATEYMNYFCTLYKIPRKEQRSMIAELLELVGLMEAADKKIHTYSKGMIQRLHISRCLINSPKLLFLDEPTIGLDPVGARMLRSLIQKLQKDGITIILTTHYMQEADELCDRIAFIKDGKISLIGSAKEIKRSSGHTRMFEAIVQMEEIEKIEKEQTISIHTMEELKQLFYSITFEVKMKEMDIQQIKQILSKYGEVVHVIQKEMSLEDAYISHMKELG
ncbi:ABC transporter ATP-binding protein [Jeotgalibacillus aurantiacus]|uniref:ABC transporter ATP-binding protein n=1 Tax=Jeotgalibacillus aurantiacus TaxID=2763266 RepID=UPI001D0BE2E6|nr:ABC transporter ATP-binding protein [Jeotgalibacillus aurantiacus]